MNRFKEQVRKLISYAQDESRRLGHESVGTDHLLLGLIASGENLAVRIMKELGVDLKDLCSELVALSGQGKHFSLAREIPLTTLARRVLDLAVEESAATGHGFGPEYVLLSLLRVQAAGTHHVLTAHGLTLPRVQRMIIKFTGRQGSALDRSTVVNEPRLTNISEAAEEIQMQTKGSHAQRFTPHAQQLIVTAEDEAHRLKQDRVNTDHLLLALLLSKSGTATRILDELGISADEIRQEIERRLVARKPCPLSRPLQFTRDARAALCLAAEEAKHLQDADLGTIHILIGLLRLAKAPTKRLLLNRGITAGLVRGRWRRI